MGEMPDGSFEPDTPPKRGGHQQSWMDLTPEQRVLHYNRNLPKGCTHKASLFDWPVELRHAFSFDPYFHVAHGMPHTAAGFFSGTCECEACVNDIGLERGSPLEFKTRRRKNSRT